MAGPIERRLSSQIHFKEFGRWPEAVVDERIEQHERDLARARREGLERVAADAFREPCQVRLTAEVVRTENITITVEGSMTDVWARRDELMAQHIPDGFEIARYRSEGEPRSGPIVKGGKK